MSQLPPSAVVTHDLSRQFGERTALAGVNLDVPSGTVFGLLGANGAGKTTTIRLLLGLLEPTAGSSVVLGYDPIRQGGQVRERSGALLQHNGLLHSGHSPFNTPSCWAWFFSPPLPRLTSA